MKQFNETIYFHRDRDDNRTIREKAESLKFKNSDDLRYLGSEVEFKVLITEENNKVLEINGIDVSDKDIFI